MSKKEKEIERIEALIGVDVKEAGKASKGGESLPQGATEAGAEEPAAVEAQVIEPEIIATPGNDLLHRLYVEEATEDQPVALEELIRQSAAEASAEDEGMGTEIFVEEPQSDDEAMGHEADRRANGQPEVFPSQASAETRPKKVPLADVLPETKERIVFDAWDNRQVKSANKKARETIDKAGLELGDHTIDTVFKGNYMAVLNSRSKEFKRFRKLGKHPELMIDPRRWTEWTGGGAVKRFCLGEGKDVSRLRG